MKGTRAFAVAILLVPVLAVLVSGQAPPAGPDLAVGSIDVAGPTPMWTDGLPTHTTVKVAVENRGDAPSGPYRILVRWADSSGTSWLNGDEAGSSDVSEGGVGPGLRNVHVIPWSLGPGHRGQGTLHAQVQPLGPDATAQNDVRTHPFFVADRKPVLEIVGSDQVLHPDETRFLLVRLTNPGNVGESVILSLAASNDEAAARLDATFEASTVSAAPGGEATIRFFVGYPFAGDTSELSVRHEVLGSRSYAAPINATTPWFNASYDPMPPASPLSIAPEAQGALRASPGNLAFLRATFTNEGQGDDVFEIDARVDKAWKTAVTPARLGLRPGESLTALVAVEFPTEAALGTTATLHVEGRSVRSTTPAAHEVPLVVQGPSVLLEPLPDWPVDPYVGDPVDVPVRIRNVGDGPTPAGAILEVRAIGLGDDPVVNSTTVSSMPPGGETVAHLGFGVYARGGPVRYEVSWSSEGPPISSQGFVTETFVHAAALAIEAPAGLEGVPGETLRYRSPGYLFRIHNQGNAAETLDLVANAQAGNAVPVSPSPPAIVVPAGESRFVAIDHVLPRPAGSLQQIDVQLSVAVQGRPGLSWTANVSSHVVDGAPPEMALVEPLPSVWAQNHPLTLLVRATDDTAVAAVAAAIHAPSGASHSLHLSPASQVGHWTVTRPLEEPGNHTFVFSARDVAGKTSMLPAVRIESRPIPAPLLSLDGPPEMSTVAENTTFFVRAVDPLGIQRLQVTVVDAGGNVVSHRDLTPDLDGSASFNVSGAPPGTLGIAVEAMNPGGASTRITRTVQVAAATAAATDDGPPGDAAAGDPVPSSESPGLGVIMTAAVALAALDLRRRRGRPAATNQVSPTFPCGRRVCGVGP